MIDIHCHPLPGVDDGADSLEVAVAMCRIAAEDGVTHLVATPHSNYTYAFNLDLNRQLLAQLQQEVGEEPKLLLGCDFHLSYDNIQDFLANSKNFTINGTQYLLVELPEQFIPENLSRVYYEIQVAGIIPIITHPERNMLLQRKPDLIRFWVEHGCLVQVTAMSYIGGFGSKAKGLAERWLDQNLVHFLATDAHDCRRRPPLLSPCYRKLAEEKGEEFADLLMRQNPQAVIDGKSLPPQPQFYEAEEAPRKRRWFSFLWGR